MGDKEDKGTEGPQTLAGRRMQRPTQEEKDEAERVASGIKAGEAYRARVLGRSPIARLTGFRS